MLYQPGTYHSLTQNRDLFGLQKVFVHNNFCLHYCCIEYYFKNSEHKQLQLVKSKQVHPNQRKSPRFLLEKVIHFTTKKNPLCRLDLLYTISAQSPPKLFQFWDNLPIIVLFLFSMYKLNFKFNLCGTIDDMIFCQKNISRIFQAILYLQGNLVQNAPNL